MDLRAWRKVWFQVHLWLGVALFLVTIPLGVTGSLLVWRDATDRFANPARYAVTKAPASLPADAYVAAARPVFKPNERVSGVRYPEHVGGPVIVTATAPPAKKGARPQTHAAWLDPANAKVVADGTTLAGLTKFAHDFHGHVLVPGIGRKIVGWLGWAMLISSLTGIWLWWPRKGPVLQGLRWTRSSLVTANLHHLVGFWIAIPLALLSLSGIWISFPQSAAALVGKGQPQGERGREGGGGPRGPQRPVETPKMSAQAAVAAALAEAGPGGRVAAVTLPTERKPKWTVQVRLGKSEPKAFEVADATGKASAVAERPGEGGGDPVARFMRRTHEGEGLTPLWKIVVFLAGLAPAVLGLTGVWMWLMSRRRKTGLAEA